MDPLLKFFMSLIFNFHPIEAINWHLENICGPNSRDNLMRGEDTLEYRRYSKENLCSCYKVCKSMLL